MPPHACLRSQQLVGAGKIDAEHANEYLFREQLMQLRLTHLTRYRDLSIWRVLCRILSIRTHQGQPMAPCLQTRSGLQMTALTSGMMKVLQLALLMEFPAPSHYPLAA